MKLSVFLSASAAFLLASAATNEPSLAEALKDFNFGDGMQDLGADGVLRSINIAQDTVIDYVQLSKSQIAEFLAGLGKEPVVMAGVDGRDVTSDAQLWALPEGLAAPQPGWESTEMLDAIRPRGSLVCEAGAPCVAVENCTAVDCTRCIRDVECGTGPPPNTCVPVAVGRCAFQAKLTG